MIGICGGFGAGKDTVAALLSMLGYQNASFASAMRREVFGFLAGQALYRPLGAYEAMPESLWEEVNTLHRQFHLQTLSIRDRNMAIQDGVFAKPTSRVMRNLLQWWGTEYRRSQDPDYWVRRLTLGWGKWTVSDVRFENEVNKIRELGGQIWRVENPRLRDDPGRDHESEKAIAEIMPDVVLVNDGDIHKLAITVRTAIG